MKHTLTLVALLSAAACVSSEAHRKVVNSNANLQAENARLLESQGQLATENARLRNENQDLGRRAADAAWIEDQKAKLAKLMERYSGSIGNANGVEMVQTPEGYALRVAGEVLFSPGENKLSDTGRKTLTELAAQLREQKIRVEGHTDDTAVVKTAAMWGTNLRLSVERAMVVADFLISTGLKRDLVSVAGYGEYRPAQQGTEDAARAKNRRVEILLLTK